MLLIKELWYKPYLLRGRSKTGRVAELIVVVVILLLLLVHGGERGQERRLRRRRQRPLGGARGRRRRRVPRPHRGGRRRVDGTAGRSTVLGELVKLNLNLAGVAQVVLRHWPDSRNSPSVRIVYP